MMTDAKTMEELAKVAPQTHAALQDWAATDLAIKSRVAGIGRKVLADIERVKAEAGPSATSAKGRLKAARASNAE